MMDRRDFRRGHVGSGRRVGSRRETVRRPNVEALELRALMTADYPTGLLTGPEGGMPLDIVLGYLARNGADYGIAPGDLKTLRVTDQYTDTVGAMATHIYLRQGYNGLSVAEADISAGVLPTGEIVSITGSFVPTLAALDAGAPPAPGMTAQDALLAAAPGLGLSVGVEPITVTIMPGIDMPAVIHAPGMASVDIPAHLQYMRTGAGATLVWNFNIQTPDAQNWYDLSVDATTGSIVSVVDWVDRFEAQYEVYTVPGKSPDDGPRTSVQDPWDKKASPFGWHDTNGSAGAEFNDTRGNNADAYEDSAAANGPGKRADGGSTRDFTFPIDLAKDPSTYQAAAITNLFYLTNIAHDINYQYGFTEAAGNFQFNNYGKGGQGGDAVRAEAQDGGGVDNANFATPPDGSQPRMQMYIFDLTNPKRDGDLDSEVVIHEYGHGVSNRLTGGPSNVSALRALQSGGMGEGWSDWWALMFTQLSSDTQGTPRPTGNYVLGLPGSGGGIRRYPYSFDLTIDPLTFDDFTNGSKEVHDAGEIWSSTLWDMNWLLINKNGFSPDLYQGYKGPDSPGNIIAMQLVMDALKLQPVNPSFIDARNAILAADQALTGGENQPEIWQAFARRGLGLSASTVDGDSTVVVTAKDIPNFLKVKVVAPTGVVEHQPLTDVVLGTVTDPVQPGPPSNYVVKIDWGDGTVSPGTLVDKGGGKFDIHGTKTYNQGGTYGLKVTVTKVGAITISGTGKIAIGDSAIFASSNDLGVQEGRPFSGQVATFTDTDITPSDPSLYQASINWGDGTVTPGQVGSLSAGRFGVSGAHSFSAGNLTMKVTVKGPGGATVTATANVISSDNAITAFPVTIGTVEGKPFNGVVATFFDDDPRPLTTGYYRAKIDWGDGSPQSDGVLAAIPGGGFSVSGAHKFLVGPIRATVTISDSDVSKTSVVSTGTAANAGLTIRASTVRAVEGRAFDGLIGRFRDENPSSKASDFVATIDWGDGSPPSDARITPDGGGDYVLIAKHMFRAFQADAYVTTITLTELAIRDQPKSATGKAMVADAPVSGQGTPVAAVEGNLFQGVIAHFKDSNTLATSQDYGAAIIAWGDGETDEISGRVVTSESDGGFDVLGSHTFAAAGTYPFTILLTNKGSQASFGGLATVSDAPLKPIPVSVDAVERTASGDVVVGAFVDGNLVGSDASQFTAAIDWGDGTKSTGVIFSTGTSSGYGVRGDHTYADPGTYVLKVLVASTAGAKTTVVSTAKVADLILPITGAIEGSSDTGSSSADGVTGSSTPSFGGTAEAGSIVHVYARPLDGGGPLEIGRATADASGRWRVTASIPGDGVYAITAQATDATGRAGSLLTALETHRSGGELVVDTAGARVARLVLDPKTSTFLITFSDDGGGLNSAAMLNPGNYQLTSLNGGRALRPTSLTLGSDGQTVSAKFGIGRGRGSYVLRILGAGLTDRAGNALVETVFVDFPAERHAPGDPFVAQISTDGRTATLPQPYVPPQQTAAARSFGRFLRSRFRTPSR